MDPQLIAIGLNLIEALIANEPALAADIKALFSSGNPTPADWAALRANVANATYGQFVPASALPAGA